MVKIASPEFSPDGERIAFLTIVSDFAHDRYDATLMVVDSAGGTPKVLVQGTRNLQMPRWSPDGHTIAFIANGTNKKAEIYIVPVNGGTPRSISDARNGVEQFAWSPDGSAIAFLTPDDPSVSAKAKLAHHDLFQIHDDDYQISHTPAPSHIWLLSVKDGTTPAHAWHHQRARESAAIRRIGHAAGMVG